MNWASWSLIINFGTENMILASNLPILRTAPLRGAVSHRTTPTAVGQLRPSSDNFDLCRPPNPRGLYFDEPNTTVEMTETKMDHAIVISIKKGSIWAQLADSSDSPFKRGYFWNCSSAPGRLVAISVEPHGLVSLVECPYYCHQLLSNLNFPPQGWIKLFVWRRSPPYLQVLEYSL